MLSRGILHCGKLRRGKKMSVRMKIFLAMSITVVVLTVVSVGMCSLFTERHVPSKLTDSGVQTGIAYPAGASIGMPHSISALTFIAFGVLAAFVASGKLAELFLKMDKHRSKIDEFSKTASIVSEKRERYIANMRRDIHKPLNSIIRMSECILGEEGVHNETRDNIEKIHNAGMTLLGIVNDIADIPVAESKNFDLTPTEYDVPSLINDIVTLHAVRISGKPINFNLHISEGLPRKLFGDELRVELICNNLLDNAFKYTKIGSVDLFFECEKDENSEWLTIQVADTGIGIRPENIERVFSNHSGMAYGKPGNKIDGTGLSVTKKIVEMMDGTIGASSEYGKGSVFTVRVRQGFVTDICIGKAVAESLKRCHYGGSVSPSDKKLARIQLPHVNVLVVDDVQANLDVAKEMLEAYGMRVDCHTSGWMAIRSVCERQVIYDAIFTDLAMPSIDGVKTATIIHEEIGTEYARNIPIFAITAGMITDSEKTSFKKTFKAILSKPIDPILLDALVVRWLAGKGDKKEYAQNHVERDFDTGALEPMKPLTNRISLESMPGSA
jgi:signal transduction histidine kinase/FixJ family two-component response regulator